MAKKLCNCPRGCKTAFVVRLATLYNEEKARGRTYYSLASDDEDEEDDLFLESDDDCLS